jgi:hypothetical protein
VAAAMDKVTLISIFEADGWTRDRDAIGSIRVWKQRETAAPTVTIEPTFGQSRGSMEIDGHAVPTVLKVEGGKFTIELSSLTAEQAGLILSVLAG